MLIIQKIKSLLPTNYRTFKNFGHKRQPVPLITTVWHGFLTVTFIGLGLEWKRIKGFIFGKEDENLNSSLNTLTEGNKS